MVIEAFVQNLEDEALKNTVGLRGHQPAAAGVAGLLVLARAFFDALRTFELRAVYRFE